MKEFTLKDVISDRILDPKTGWRDRLPEEVIELTDEQKESFLLSFGKGRRPGTKGKLERFIDNPRGYALSANRWWLNEFPGWAIAVNIARDRITRPRCRILFRKFGASSK